jgi:hypothetical protein
MVPWSKFARSRASSNEGRGAIAAALLGSSGGVAPKPNIVNASPAAIVPSAQANLFM